MRNYDTCSSSKLQKTIKRTSVLIVKENVKRLNIATNTAQYVQKIRASINHNQNEKIETISKTISKTVNNTNYLKNEVFRVISDSSLTTISVDSVEHHSNKIFLPHLNL